jgi:hypothetical protein
MKMTKQKLLVLILLIAAVSTVIALQVKRKAFSQSETINASPPTRTRESGIEAEEYAVYAAVIKYNDRDDNPDRIFVIEEQPSPWITPSDAEKSEFYDEMRKSSSALQAETVEDLRAKNKESFKFTRNFNISRQYALISDAEIESIFKGGVGDGWKRFNEKYPKSNGISTFSRVGFNADKTQALVYRGNRCEGLCGSGLYYLLSKKNGVWTITGNVGPSWIS